VMGDGCLTIGREVYGETFVAFSETGSSSTKTG
jgi:hypothetical protein